MKRSFFLLLACTAFTTYAENPISIHFELLAKSTTMWDGTVLPAYPDGQPEISIVKVTIDPGQKLPMHQHPRINAGYLIRGTLTVHSEAGQELQLKAGDTLIELVDKWHYGYNPGTESAEIVVFYAGTPGTPLSIKHATSPSSTTPKK